MTPEERSLLERTHKIAVENNEILRSMRRMNRISGIFNILYWVVIIGISIGLYYYIQPLVESMLGVLGDAQGAIVGDTGAVQNITNALNMLNGL